MTNPYDAYRKVQFETADPGQLLLMLYKGAVRSLDTAGSALRSRDYTTSNKEIVRTQNILLELLRTLDHQHGDIPATLSELYNYLYQALIEANVRKDEGTVNHVRGIMARLSEAFETAVTQARSTALPATGVDVRFSNTYQESPYGHAGR